jgi:heme exporter protein D
VSAVVLIIAALFLAMGGYALALPARVLAIFGIPVTTVDGRNEVSAVYGGFGIAIGGVLALALAVPSLRAGILVAVAAALFGMASGRLIAAGVDRPPGFYPWLFFALELVGAVALAAAAEAGP